MITEESVAMCSCGSAVDKQDEYNNISVDFPRWRRNTDAEFPRYCVAHMQTGVPRHYMYTHGQVFQGIR